jgi:hypothetical protein
MKNNIEVNKDILVELKEGELVNIDGGRLPCDVGKFLKTMLLGSQPATAPLAIGHWFGSQCG